MSVTALLFTCDLNEQAQDEFRRVRDIVDELLIFVDRDLASQETYRRAAAIATAVEEVACAGLPEVRREMIERCRTEWILRLDSDETLSEGWFRNEWRAILARTEVTHYLLPRRWLVSAAHFIGSSPWWPDLSLRLFRNKPAETILPTRLHDPMRMAGAAEACPSLFIDHHVLRTPRAVRDEKVAHYESLRPGGALAYFYQYEDFPFESLPLPRSEPSVPLRPLTMRRLTAYEISAIALELDAAPDHLICDGCAWAVMTIRNGSSIPISSAPPFPVNISYHWRSRDAAREVVFDGERTAVFPLLAPGQTRTLRAFVLAPPSAGEYSLQFTIVQEHATWFEQVTPAVVRSAHVVVSPRP